jgi:HD-GYP domain-containing protein (c-di-GMP phosphodiesterase class II)
MVPLSDAAAEPEPGADPTAAIATVRELCAAVAGAAPLREFAVAAQLDHEVELSRGDARVAMVWPAVWRDPSQVERHLQAVVEGKAALVLCGSEAELAGVVPTLRGRAAFAAVALPVSAGRLALELGNACEMLSLRRRVAEGAQTAERYRYEVDKLLRTARALASERDVRKLLAAILHSARRLTGADAGSVYVLEGEAERADQRLLHFMLSQNDSQRIDFSERTLPIDGTSIVGAAVLTRKPINLADLYAPEFAANPYGFHHDRSFDEKTGYQTRSMLTVPMLDAHDEVIGVIQLINRKREPSRRLERSEDFLENVVAFDAKAEELALALASQAGVSLENALLYKEVRDLFEGFVHASVIAIESRDPTTSGHSQRVATLTVELARVVDRVEAGPLAQLHFGPDDLKEIEYAGLLHDFGKVGVREKVLVKAKKLYDHERDLIQARFDYIRKALEAEQFERKIAAGREAWPAIDGELAARRAELDRYLELVVRANEPTVLPEGGFEALKDIAARSYRTPGGEERPYLSPDEVAALSIPRGTLTDVERMEIESHVTHTYNFLRKIPWGRQFQDVPMIAGSHHETLDGRGYPRHLSAPAIPVEARMMSIADIFDALTASDRPYKKAIPADKALSIIESEVGRGRLDAELFRVFVEAKIFQIVLAQS